MRNLRLAVGVPSGSHWLADFGISLVGLMTDFMARPIPGFQKQEARLIHTKGSILSRSRQKLVMEAQNYRATHLLFLDSDMKFLPTIARDLLKHNLPVVAANCATKMLPSTPTARQKSDKLSGLPVYTLPDSPQIEKVWRVGTGVMLIDMGVVSHIPKPYFEIKWVEELQDYQGEDWTFCEKLEAAKVPIYVDHHVSAGIGHVGELVYAHDVVEIKK